MLGSVHTRMRMSRAPHRHYKRFLNRASVTDEFALTVRFMAAMAATAAMTASSTRVHSTVRAFGRARRRRGVHASAWYSSEAAPAQTNNIVSGPVVGESESVLELMH